MNIFTYLFEQFGQKHNNGATDNQSELQKSLNYTQSEFVTSATPVQWIEKNQSQWKKFPTRNQSSSLTCVCQTYAKECSIIFQQKYGVYVDFSASFPYQYRGGTYGGCNSTDIYDIFPTKGNIFEYFMPSQNMREAEVMAVKRESYFDDLAKVYNFKRISVVPMTFENVASTIQSTGKGVMVWFKFSDAEWTSMPQVFNKPTTSGHSVTAVDFCLVNGKKYLVIDDSWGLTYAMNGQRLISEEYFKARCFLSSYLMNFKVQNNDSFTRPHFDGTVNSLQDCLKWEGLFPSNIESNNIFGNITKTSLAAFQKRHNVLPSIGNFGPLTKAKLTLLYP